MRLQLALNVSDLDRAVAFYSHMFGVAPHKRKPGYANFEVAEPPLKLVLFEAPGAPERLNHLGVEVLDDAQVRDAAERFDAAGLSAERQSETACCYAVQNKVWAREPDGLRWEWYRVLQDTDAFDGQGPEPAEARPCCS